MDLRITLLPFKSICVLVLLVLVCVSSSSTIEKHAQGCSIEGIDLGLCLNQKNISFSIDGECCKVLNKVVQSGFNCLCLLLASSFPILSTPISLPLSNCFITIPPLTLCKVLAPMPIVLPPNAPTEVNQPFLPPLPANALPMNSTGENSSTVPATQPPPTTVSPPKGMQISSSSTTMTSPTKNVSSPQPTCDSNKEKDTSKGSHNNKIIRLHHYVLFISVMALKFR